ncbi:MAG: sulfite exporter TauE/SafE family protein [Saprospiraceae bacterium]|nr:sulfite exporter TauE/SafE family protein [Saprospiraceae bacterium]
MTVFQYILVIAGSFLAGGINTLAGNGSVITLSLLTNVLGLPGNIANGTNRVGIVFQTAGTGLGFMKSKVLDLERSRHIIIYSIIGAIAGVFVALKVSNEIFLEVFKYMMIVMFIAVLFKPERWLIESDKAFKLSKWVTIPAYLMIGFYGGFIQMGAGIFILIVLVLASRYSMMEANAVKTVVIFIYTFLAMLIFAFQGLIDWKIGLVMAVGQSAGGFLTAAYLSRLPRINLWAYRLLITIIVFSLLIQFDIIHL